MILIFFISVNKKKENRGKEQPPLYLTSNLGIHFVSDVRIQPDSLTIFNHPSNVISLALSNGSGHFHAEIETITSSQPSTTNRLGNVLKISQINENSVVVSPLTNNGLTYLHIYDYCVPPQTELISKITSLLTWQPYATSKIQVAGINTILVNYEDDKVQVKEDLKIYVQISDATGNLIRTKYFSLMNLKAKLTNVEESVNSQNQQTSSQSGSPRKQG